MLCLRECDPSYSRSSIANILFVNYESSVNEYDSNLFWCETLNINHWSYENGLCTCCISSLCPYLQTIVELQGMLQNASEQCYYFILFCVVECRLVGCGPYIRSALICYLFLAHSNDVIVGLLEWKGLCSSRVELAYELDGKKVIMRGIAL